MASLICIKITDLTINYNVHCIFAIYCTVKSNTQIEIKYAVQSKLFFVS